MEIIACIRFFLVHTQSTRICTIFTIDLIHSHSSSFTHTTGWVSNPGITLRTTKGFYFFFCIFHANLYKLQISIPTWMLFLRTHCFKKKIPCSFQSIFFLLSTNYLSVFHFTLSRMFSPITQFKTHRDTLCELLMYTHTLMNCTIIHTRWIVVRIVFFELAFIQHNNNIFLSVHQSIVFTFLE